MIIADQNIDSWFSPKMIFDEQCESNDDHILFDNVKKKFYLDPRIYQMEYQVSFDVGQFEEVYTDVLW